MRSRRPTISRCRFQRKARTAGTTPAKLAYCRRSALIRSEPCLTLSGPGCFDPSGENTMNGDSIARGMARPCTRPAGNSPAAQHGKRHREGDREDRGAGDIGHVPSPGGEQRAGGDRAHPGCASGSGPTATRRGSRPGYRSGVPREISALNAGLPQPVAERDRRARERDRLVIVSDRGSVPMPTAIANDRVGRRPRLAAEPDHDARPAPPWTITRSTPI